MKIHEYQAKEIFKKAGIPVIDGLLATTLEEAKQISTRVGFPLVLKAQVLTGGRGKAGGIKVVQNKKELENAFVTIKNLNIKGYAVDKVLIVRSVDIQKEFYTALTIDYNRDDVVLIASSAGGVDIEETAKKNPEKIHKFYLNGKKEYDRSRWKNFIQVVFPDPALQEPATDILKNLLPLFYQYDCTLAEINPLIIDSQGQLFALDAKMELDENALFRHPEFSALRDLKYEDPDEIEAKEKNLSFVKMDGNVGCIVNGAGLAMATMDIVKLLGGNPANFLDVGGSSSPEKVLNALKIILRNKKVKSVLINIFGGITRCDDIARGILEARKQWEIPVPLVIRLTGTNEKEAKELLAANNLKIFNTMREAVQEAIRLAK